MDMDIFERLESEVRSYCRSFPTVFKKAQGARLVDETDRSYLDFFSGAGALNYGHNCPAFKKALVDYIQSDGVTHSLDMHTVAKREFLETFEELILKPRKLDFKVMFPGPTGTNAVESALKLARTITGRSNVIAFTNAFHGMTLGSLALTGNSGKRDGAGVALTDVARMPFHGYMGTELDTIDLLEQHLVDTSSGVDLPAAVILEVVQAEGGVNVASNPWLRRLTKLLRRFNILLIIDDIQVGCGRTGPFFSFESAGIQPDMVCLSKSLSGYGTPFSLTLMRPDLDVWPPGKHNGTFRGHNLAFVTAKAALKEYWTTNELAEQVKHKGTLVRHLLDDISGEIGGKVRGRGLIQGIEFEDASLAGTIAQQCFERGLLIETAGPSDEVLKVLPPLTISEDDIRWGMGVIAESSQQAFAAAKE